MYSNVVTAIDKILRSYYVSTHVTCYISRDGRDVQRLSYRMILKPYIPIHLNPIEFVPQTIIHPQTFLFNSIRRNTPEFWLGLIHKRWRNDAMTQNSTPMRCVSSQNAARHPRSELFCHLFDIAYSGMRTMTSKTKADVNTKILKCPDGEQYNHTMTR